MSGGQSGALVLLGVSRVELCSLLRHDSASIGYWCRMIMVCRAVALIVIIRVDPKQKNDWLRNHVHIYYSASCQGDH